MAYVTVPKDLTHVKSKVLFGLTKRQLVCFGGALLTGGPLYFLARNYLSNSAAALLMIFAMLPGLLFALFERHGQPLEVVIQQMIQCCFIRPKERPYQTNNAYAALVRQYQMEQEVKAIVVACNTASAMALETIREEIDIPIIGVVKPGAKVAARTTRNKKIGLIGTRGTVNSELYPAIIHEYDPRIQVIGQACPLLVPLVEEGWLKDKVTVEVTKRYLDPLLEQGVDTLILGCTHYPLLRSLMRQVAGESVTLVNPAYETARALRELLKEHGIENDGHEEEEFPYRFYVSDAEERFQEFAGSILPYDVRMTKQINIEEY